MIIIGEKLNSSIPSALKAMRAGGDELSRLIKIQSDAGAKLLDINTAMLEDGELDMMKQLISLVIAESDCGIMLDSPSPAILEEAAKLCEERGEDRRLIFNSVTADERIDELAPIAARLGCGIVVLPMNCDGIPETAEGRLELAKQAIAKLTDAGVDEENIYIDAICETLATLDTNAKTALDTIRLVSENTNAKTVCGLSNVSFGLPKRAFINSAFMSAALYAGLDAAIIDPTSPELRKAIFAGSAVAGRDEFCMDYITFIREEYDV